jgi:hypothetical protein
MAQVEVWSDSCKSPVMPRGVSGRRNITQKSKSVVEAPSGAEHDYYGARIRDATTGPRRELSLRIETWPNGKVTFGSGKLVTLRFGAVVNYEEVLRFFIKVPVSGLHYLRELSESTPRRHVIEMEFDGTGDRIRIIAGKVSRLAGESTGDA